MAHQYFENNEDLAHERQEIKLNLPSIQLSLTTDSGVFSRDRVDYGTMVLLKAIMTKIQSAATQKISVLDVGCGYGPIGLALAKLSPQIHVDMIDVNERALQLAQENAAKNGVDTQVNIFQSDGYTSVPAKQYDFVITNPPIRAGKKVVDSILKGSQEFLTAQGAVFAVLQKKQGAPSAKKLLETIYPRVETIKRDKGYYILAAQNNFD